MGGIERQIPTIVPCCLCLSEDESTFHVNSTMKSMPLHELVDFCIGIQINDEKGVRPFSTSICNECVLNINNFYTFKKKVLEAQELINSLSAKNETNNDNSVEYVDDEIVQIVDLNEEPQLLEEDSQNGTEMEKIESSRPDAAKPETQMIRIVKVGSSTKKRTIDVIAPKLPNKKSKVDDASTEKITIQMNECLICPAILGDILELQDHIDIHNDIKCKACNRQFARYSNLKRHFNSVHSKPKPFQCDICGLGFNFSVNLQTHAALHYSGKIRRE